MTKRKKIIIWAIVAVLIVGGIVIASLNGKPKVEYNTATALMGDLTQTVSETGTIKPEKELDLNFAAAGRIAVVNVKIGDTVTGGTVLAELDKSDLLIKLKEAQARLSIARAQLSKLVSGASAEDKAVAQANYESALKDLETTDVKTQEAVNQAEKDSQNINNSSSKAVSQARTALDNAKKTYQKAIDNKQNSLITSLQNKLPVASTGLDAVNRYLLDVNISGSFSKKNSSYLTLTNTTYNSAKNLLSLAQSEAPTTANTEVNYQRAISALNESLRALTYCFSALESSIDSPSFTQTEIDAAKATISAQQTAVSAAITTLETNKQAWDDAVIAYETNVNAASAALDEAITKTANALTNALSNREQLMSAAQSRLSVAKAQLNKTLAKARVEDVMLEQGQVRQAEANVDLINNQISNNRIIAPNDGVITKIAYQAGEQAVPGQAVIGMIANNNFSIEIDVSETDIAKVKIGNKASVYLDAFGEDVEFEALVNFVEPAETIIQGVTYYKVKISFTPSGEREIKSGMTATAKIITDSRQNIVMIPARAVIEQANIKIVKTLKDQVVKENQVQLGMSGDNGLVEVISGIASGEEVITSTKSTTK
ncbi:MAG TPA: efflux RND transporter periplasmic adaptor subunit [bacterium]|nr:efflux RND transporter periplasmic adaptor subunit [bacterium]